MWGPRVCGNGRTRERSAENYRQRIWYTLRVKAITIKGIDNLFALTENPIRFYSKDVLVRAKVATVMALATWSVEDYLSTVI